MTQHADKIKDYLRKLPSSHFLDINTSKYTSEDIESLEYLCGKVEGSKKILQANAKNNHNSLSNEALSKTDIDKLVCHLLLLYLDTHDYKFINCVLKLRDGILKIPIYTMNLELRVIIGNILHAS